MVDMDGGMVMANERARLTGISEAASVGVVRKRSVRELHSKFSPYLMMFAREIFAIVD